MRNSPKLTQRRCNDWRYRYHLSTVTTVTARLFGIG